MEEKKVELLSTEKLGEKRKYKKYRAFIKGPIQLLWITKACKLTKSAMRVALAISFLKGIHGDTWFKLESSATEKFSLKRQSKSNGLQELQKEGLIQIKQDPGSLPLIKIINQISERKNCLPK